MDNLDAMNNLRGQVDSLLKQRRDNTALPEVNTALAAGADIAPVGPLMAPVQKPRFSPFIPGQMEEAIKLAGRFMELADTQGLDAVVVAAQQAQETYSLDFVKYAMMVFMTHHPQGKLFSIPSLEERIPEKILPSTLTTTFGASDQHMMFARTTLDTSPVPVDTAQASDPEAALAWYREDPKANEHHEHWHIVYPHAGIRTSWQGLPVLKDRQDELFFYMHQQMLARYDTERIALGLPRTQALSDYTTPIQEGYDPGPYITDAEGNPYTARPAGLHLGDLEVTNYTVADMTARRDRINGSIESGFLTHNNQWVPITANLLGATVEASIGSASAPGDGREPALTSLYGSIHNMGHVFLGSITDPVNELQMGAIADTATAIRDPVFYRWHKHIDDFSFHWQERQAPNTFTDAPLVLIRKSLENAPTTAVSNQSPDIILALKDDGSGTGPLIPGSGDAGFNGQAYGEQSFGGTNWNTDFSSSAVTTNELHTRMFQRDINWGPDNANTITINYLDQEKEFFYFVRVQNQVATQTSVTVRIFLVAQQVAEDRRMWIEMDKFRYTLKPSEKAVIFRPASLSSVIRKPAVRPPTAVRPSSTGDSKDMNNYCDCGWPYNLLLPRGTRAGMGFRLLVMLTDWQRDQVAEDTTCGSMSYCGAKDRYPDSRSMGYPFDRPFPEGTTIAQTIAAHNNMATRDIIIKWVG